MQGNDVRPGHLSIAGSTVRKKCGRKSLSLLSPLPFVPLFPDIRTMAGLAFLLSCQRLHTKKFPLLALPHSIKSSKTILYMFSISSMVRNFAKLKFSFSDFYLFRTINQQSLTVAFIAIANISLFVNYGNLLLTFAPLVAFLSLMSIVYVYVR